MDLRDQPWFVEPDVDLDIPPDKLNWLAGLIEGEGSFVVGKVREGHRVPRIVIAVPMTDRDVIHRVLSETGVGRVNGPYFNKKPSKPYYRYVLCQNRYVYALAAKLHPLMGDRRKGQIEKLARAYCESVDYRYRMPEHGLNSYRRRKCRCDICVDAMRSSSRKYKAARREKTAALNGIPQPQYREPPPGR